MRIFAAALTSSALLAGTVGIPQTDAAMNQTISTSPTSVKLAKVKNKKRGRKYSKYNQQKGCSLISIGGFYKATGCR
jgi:hypothetical protein